MKRNFETGKLLLVATLLLSLNLVIQLFSVAESIDLSSGISISGMGVNLTASYLLTATSMIIVVHEFFQVKTKMRGLMALNALLERVPVPDMTAEGPVDEISGPVIQSKQVDDDDLLEELVIEDDEDDFDSLLDEFSDETEEDALGEESGLVAIVDEDEEIMSKYKTQRIKIDEETGEVEPMLDDGGLQELIEQADLATDEAQQLAKIVAESEIIQTLNELEVIVQELKAKKSTQD